MPRSTEEIIGDRRIVGVSLTGSERAGAVVASIAGRNLKKCVLELGGSDAYVVLDSDDVKASADLARDTRIGNTGQACNSNKRMIVTSDIFDDFVGQLVERAKGLKAGDPAEAAEGTFAPMSSRKAAEGLNELVQDAVAKGATLHAGGVLGGRRHRIRGFDIPNEFVVGYGLDYAERCRDWIASARSTRRCTKTARACRMRT